MLALVAWGIPMVGVAVALFAIPDPDRPLADFPSTDLLFPSISVKEPSGTRGKRYFQLNITGEDGWSFHLRNPEREPIVSLFDRIPKSVGLKITYGSSLEGSVLLDVRAIDGKGPPFLDFATVMNEYAGRRRFVFWVAGIWFVIGSLLFYGLASVKIDQPPADVSS